MPPDRWRDGENMGEDLFEEFDFELLGIESLLEESYEQFKECLFIKGDSDYRLGTCLKECSEYLQDRIAEEYKLELGQGKERKKQLKLLEQKILEEMPEQLEVIPMSEFHLLIKLAFGECDIEEATRGISLQRKGWIFYYIDNEEQETISVVPHEVMDRLKEITETHGFTQHMAYYEMIRCCISAFLNLYGVFEKRWISGLLEKYHIEEIEEKIEEPIEEPLEETVLRLKEEAKNFGMEDEYLYDFDLEEEDYKERFDAIKDMPYYEPSVEELLFYRDNLIDEHLNEYRILKRYLGKKVESRVMLERLMEELSIEAVEELGGIFAIPEIMERYEGIFSSAGELEEFEKLFRDWEDHVRKWNNRGFTNAEMRERGEQGSRVKIDWELVKVKFKERIPDPEAPCPCGSGKKYRQCCGRVKK